MYSFNDYIDKKNELIMKMESVKSRISELDAMGIEVSDAIKKIDSAITIVREDKISIVLVGAFSDGKTSVAAGWINERLNNMKIDSDESSDEILCYTPSSIPEGCQIVDTPGLFGDKIGSDENGGQVALSDITKKYISEANLILYVVAAKNPIKDSHKECIRWILKDLNKLSSTVFVINRMDDVADLTDDEEYSLQAKIKTDNLRGKLVECGLTQLEANTVKVACISAAPNGKGIEVWNAHYDEYLRRSRLSALERITNAILQNSREALITKTGCDVLNDEISKMLDIISDQETQIAEIIIPEKKESLKRNKKDLEALYKRIIRSKKDMKDAIKALNKKKISIIRAVTIDNFKDTLEDEIGMLPGKEGYILNEEINDIFIEYAERFSGWAMELGSRFQAEYDKQNKMMNNLLAKGAASAANSLKVAGKVNVATFKNAIFAGRDLLGKLGVVIKFKPWQVTKMATFATKALPVIGAGIDVVTNLVENITAQERNRKFEKAKENIKDAINETFFDIMRMLDSDEKYISQFAPSYKVLEEQVAQDQADIENQERMLQTFYAWRRTTKELF